MSLHWMGFRPWAATALAMSLAASHVPAAVPRRVVQTSPTPLVVCTTTMIADLARNLAAGRFEVIGIMRPGEDPHLYDAKPMDAITIRKAQVLLRNGLRLEGTLENIIENNLPPAALNVALAEHPRIKPLESLQYQGAPDPHCWLNVGYFKLYAERCRDTFIKADPGGTEAFRGAARDYLKQLGALHAFVKRELARIPKPQRILITSHDAFQYFGRAYDVEVHAILGISTEQEPKPQDIERLITLVRTRHVKAVFIETSVSPALNNLVRKVSRRTGARVGGILHSDSLGEEETPAGTYLGMVRSNVEKIVEALR